MASLQAWFSAAWVDIAFGRSRRDARFLDVVLFFPRESAC
jgi:hypothetical protein